MRKIKRALISVSEKQGIVDFARGLIDLDIEILSTGGTAKLLAESGLKVTEVSDYTGFPEMMDGRLKTLHPKIHGGLLGRRGIDDEAMHSNGILPIDLLVVNLYPFQNTVAKPGCTLSNAIENIDIGGPTMLRAAAKNNVDVTVVVNQTDYASILQELRNNNSAISRKTRFQMAMKAFEHTAQYDAAIANYLGTITNPVDELGERVRFPNTFNNQFIKRQDLRYGENPHQEASFYQENNPPSGCISSATQLQGKPLSYNNIADTDAALECVKQFDQGPACVIVKHANPCGVATGKDVLTAYDRAYRTDATSAFGGIIAFNQALDAATAKEIIDRQFVEVIIAPAVDNDCLAVLASKSNIRVLVCDQWQKSTGSPPLDYKRVTGGLLIQDTDIKQIAEADLKTVSKREATAQETKDLLFAWKVAKFVKSNAIVYARDEMTIGVGAGQMSRVYSARIAGIKAADANLTVKGSVMASDAFFPFRDGLDSAAGAGITAVIQPGGSMRDQEVIDAADEHNIAMLFTGVRHFRH